MVVRSLSFRKRGRLQVRLIPRVSVETVVYSKLALKLQNMCGAQRTIAAASFWGERKEFEDVKHYVSRKTEVRLWLLKNNREGKCSRAVTRERLSCLCCCVTRL